MKPIIAARLAAGLGAALLALAVMHPARAAYPDRPIRMVVPFPPGSITDVVARSLGKAMADDLGQPVVVENKPGANGIIGTHDVARSKPDGYTVVVVGVSTAASGVSLFKNLPYDPAVDLSPIGAVAETPYLLVGSPRLPGASVAELYAYGARHPGKLTYAYGSGSAQVFGAKWARLGGIDVTAVPYRGGPQALTDVIGGTVDLTFTDLANGLQRARRQGQDLWRQHAGTVPAGARHSHAERERRARLQPDRVVRPDGSEGSARAGIPAPGGRAGRRWAMPSEGSLRGAGPFRENQTPAQFGAFVRAEIDKWAAIVRKPASSRNEGRAVAACHPRIPSCSRRPSHVPDRYPQALPHRRNHVP